MNVMINPEEIDSSSGLSLKTPLPVTILEIDREVWASALDVSGKGNSEGEAKADLWAVLVDEYEHLDTNRLCLGARRIVRLSEFDSFFQKRLKGK
jgi:hypothetical protein